MKKTRKAVELKGMSNGLLRRSSYPYKHHADEMVLMKVSSPSLIPVAGRPIILAPPLNVTSDERTFQSPRPAKYLLPPKLSPAVNHKVHAQLLKEQSQLMFEMDHELYLQPGRLFSVATVKCGQPMTEHLVETHS